MTSEPLQALRAACANVGIDAGEAEPIRTGENYLYRLPGHIVARVSRRGQSGSARKEVQVSRWLATSGVRVVQIVAEVPQPIEVDGRAVTFWHELPPHQRGTLAQLADVLRQLHALPTPDFTLPPLAPFVRLRERLADARALPDDGRDWLLVWLNDLEQRYGRLSGGRPWCAVHGDAWEGNVASTEQGPILLDLERFAFGPPEWDLVSIAVDYTTFGLMSFEEWQGFCRRYGYDVTTWDGFELLRDIRELRKVTFAWQLADTSKAIADQARYRLACVRGDHGPRPWGWTEVP